MNKIVIILLGILMFISACSFSNKEEPTLEAPIPINVDLSITPEQIKVGTEVNFWATVKQGNDEVNDANKVEFEIWKDGQEKHQMIVAENIGGGVYKVSRTFNETGKYYVISHVTARDMHTMPKKEFIIE